MSHGRHVSVETIQLVDDDQITICLLPCSGTQVIQRGRSDVCVPHGGEQCAGCSDVDIDLSEQVQTVCSRGRFG